VELEERRLQFLYTADGAVHLMDGESFEEHVLPLDLLDLDARIHPLLQEGMPLRVQYHEGRPLLARVPEQGAYTIADTAPPGTSGSGGGGSGGGSDDRMGWKAATLDSGTVVKVPDFYDVGARVLVELRTGKYLGRAQPEAREAATA
jgi:elongation factor P